MSSPQTPTRGRRRFRPDRDVEEWHGKYVRYDIVKEFTIAFVVVLVLVLGFSIIFSSPDDKPVTIQSWSRAVPLDFAQTAITELDGTSATATYGPPYNTTPDASQSLGPVSLEHLVGVHIPLDTATADVIAPLGTLPNRPVLAGALRAYLGAPLAQQQKWDAAYQSGIAKASFSNGSLVLPGGRYGPVAVMISSLTSMARSGALDGAVVSSKQFYGTDYTKPLLFIADGTYLESLATADHLDGDQWGMMNETGNYPGQAWLWLYTMWYQVPPMSTSGNSDVLVWGLMMLLTLLLVLVPFIPGLRSIPRKVGLYKLIWRQHYRSLHE